MEAKLVIATPSPTEPVEKSTSLVSLYERGKTGRRQVHESFSIYLNSDYRLDTAWREIWVMRVALLQPDLLAVKLKNTKL